MAPDGDNKNNWHYWLTTYSVPCAMLSPDMTYPIPFTLQC